MIKNLPSIILIVALGLFTAAVVGLGAWSSPIANPPACPPGVPGCEAPLTTGDVFQSKKGGLTVQGWTEAHGGIKVGPGPTSSWYACPNIGGNCGVNTCSGQTSPNSSCVNSIYSAFSAVCGGTLSCNPPCVCTSGRNELGWCIGGACVGPCVSTTHNCDQVNTFTPEVEPLDVKLDVRGGLDVIGEIKAAGGKKLYQCPLYHQCIIGGGTCDNQLTTDPNCWAFDGPGCPLQWVSCGSPIGTLIEK